MPYDSRTRTPSTRRKRADARRNRDRILAAATEAMAERGAEASLEEIARRAGVGSATLHRHFPSRRRLLEAVFRDRVEGLCAAARDLATAPKPGDALVTWLRAVATHASSNRGLAASLIPGAPDGDPALGSTCHTMIMDVGRDLLDRARTAGAVDPGIAIDDLLKLVNAISMATETRARRPSAGRPPAHPRPRRRTPAAAHLTSGIAPTGGLARRRRVVPGPVWVVRYSGSRIVQRNQTTLPRGAGSTPHRSA